MTMNMKYIFIILLLFVIACDPVTKTELEKKLIHRIDSLNQLGYDITDYHAHLKGGLSMEHVIKHSKKTGIDYGVAVNAGLGFPVHNDSTLSRFYHTMKDYPVALAVQAEGREWVDLVSPDTVVLYDYVFTDAMTFTDAKGRRMRLWIKDEVFVDDEQEFMEYLVQKIEDILKDEPIDIYVNPFYLPEIIRDKYDELWTEERLERVVRALKDNNVALEINARLKLPKPKLIKMAKKADVKFTFGTNNVSPELGYLAYCLKMIDECDLEPSDFWRHYE